VEKRKNYYIYLRIIGLALFIYIIFNINIHELYLIFKKTNFFYFFLSIILLPISAFFGGYKWGILVNLKDSKASLKFLIEAHLKGLFLGIITPGRLGEFYRAKYLSEKTGSSLGRNFYTALVDRIMDIIITVAVSLLSIVFFVFSVVDRQFAIILLGITSIIIFGVVIILFMLFEGGWTKKILNRMIATTSFKKWGNIFIGDFFDSVKELSFFVFVRLLILALISYFLSVFIYFILALSLGLKITFLQLFFINALVWIILLFPITFLGLGTRDASYIFFFSILNIGASSAVAFSMLILFTGIILSIPGVILFLSEKTKSDGRRYLSKI